MLLRVKGCGQSRICWQRAVHHLCSQSLTAFTQKSENDHSACIDVFERRPHTRLIAGDFGRK